MQLVPCICTKLGCTAVVDHTGVDDSSNSCHYCNLESNILLFLYGWYESYVASTRFLIFDILTELKKTTTATLTTTTPPNKRFEE